METELSNQKTTVNNDQDDLIEGDRPADKVLDFNKLLYEYRNRTETTLKYTIH